MDAKPPRRRSLFSTQTHYHTFYPGVNLMDAICVEYRSYPFRLGRKIAVQNRLFDKLSKIFILKFIFNSQIFLNDFGWAGS